MWILCLAEDSLETSSLVSEKQWKILTNVVCSVVIGALRVKILWCLLYSERQSRTFGRKFEFLSYFSKHFSMRLCLEGSQKPQRSSYVFIWKWAVSVMWNRVLRGMDTFRRNNSAIFIFATTPPPPPPPPPLLKEGSNLKEKNLLPWEQILSFKSRLHFQGASLSKKINRKSQQLPPFITRPVTGTGKLTWQCLAHHVNNFNVKTLTFC